MLLGVLMNECINMLQQTKIVTHFIKKYILLMQSG